VVAAAPPTPGAPRVDPATAPTPAVMPPGLGPRPPLAAPGAARLAPTPRASSGLGVELGAGLESSLWVAAGTPRLGPALDAALTSEPWRLGLGLAVGGAFCCAADGDVAVDGLGPRVDLEVGRRVFEWGRLSGHATLGGGLRWLRGEARSTTGWRDSGKSTHRGHPGIVSLDRFDVFGVEHVVLLTPLMYT